jgi:hypothetical protein
MMQWEKKGQIFSFSQSPFSKRFYSHAQSPQALVLNDFIRVYFSTRNLDSSGKFLSIVQYVDYLPDFSESIGYSEHEVLPLGKSGCFDEHGIFPFNPFMDKNDIYGYTSGWTRRISVDVDSGIGIVKSVDQGKTFSRLGDGPVLTASLNEPFLVIDGFVRIFNQTYYMFYIFGVKWSLSTPTPERVYKISYATSENGIDWKKSGDIIIPDRIGENECQALPTVIEYQGVYHMVFCYREMLDFRTSSSKGYRLGYAYSDDLAHWQRADERLGLDFFQMSGMG